MYICKPRASKGQFTGHVCELSNYGLPLNMHCSFMYLTWINNAPNQILVFQKSCSKFKSSVNLCFSAFLFSYKSIDIDQ